VLIGGEGDWREVLDRDEVDVVLWPSTAKLGRAIARDDGWTIGHRQRDGSGVEWLVACRAGTAVADRCAT